MAKTLTDAVPRAFRPDRAKTPGRYPLLEVFRGLTEVPPFSRYPGAKETNLETAKTSWARIFDGPGYIYVAPRTVPPEIRAAGYNMLTSPENEVVIAKGHLTGSPEMDVYLDVIHEFLHILQRRDGRDIWPGPSIPYVDRPTEIEAYAFSVEEARRLGLGDAYLRKYLEVFWVSKADHRRLLERLGVALPRPRKTQRAPGRDRAKNPTGRRPMHRKH